MGASASVFNATVAGFAIASAWESGFLEALRDESPLDITDFAAKHDLHTQSVRGMVSALASVDVVVRAHDTVHVGPSFDEVYRDKAFFHWLTIGCAELFADMPNILRNENRAGTFYRRNAAAIGYACRDINLHSFDPVFWSAMEGLDFAFHSVADLGCGTGGRLAQIAARYPGVTGVGIDIAPSALRDAASYLDVAGFGDRFSFVQGDARALAPDPRFAEVEVLTCFMMGHDFWPRDECVASLRRIREAFPNARRLLLGDTARTVGIPDRDKPVFTLAFETAHDLMGVYLPTLAEWEGVFVDSGWTCHAVRPVSVPADSFLYELA
ncbi:class I SAM-dependent methyltransferase [Micromonospora sp. NPDC047793]|uniref:class I SAM-dependent methyltransferase n=1 Tax=unclassified Micromonospora TaxID=2617518 RepID=UPI001033EB9A|nr:class I SAM-dependent methyltransferase [Verrucosispora sp. SN26_14.1]TBL45467.1 methyltransferase domain-containing protein [Verrucosispora sp. SN26_14.1]